MLHPITNGLFELLEILFIGEVHRFSLNVCQNEHGTITSMGDQELPLILGYLEPRNYNPLK